MKCLQSCIPVAGQRPRGGSALDRVPFLACINLVEREDRYAMISREFEQVGILGRVHWHRPKRHPSSGRIGCFESHLAVFRKALEAKVPFAVVFEDDVRFSPSCEVAFERLLGLVDSGMPWKHASLQNSGGEVLLTREGDEGALPGSVKRGAFYFTRCYAITAAAMEQALHQGVSAAHIDVALAVACWGGGFLVRPAAVLDVPSRSDNDWAEGGWGPWLAGQMQGFTHLPCVLGDRMKTQIMPRFVPQPRLEAKARKKLLDEPGAAEHAGDGILSAAGGA